MTMIEIRIIRILTIPLRLTTYDDDDDEFCVFVICCCYLLLYFDSSTRTRYYTPINAKPNAPIPNPQSPIPIPKFKS